MQFWPIQRLAFVRQKVNLYLINWCILILNINNAFLNQSFMKPFLTNATPNLIDTMPHCCMPIARCLTTNEQIGLVDIYLLF